MDRSPAPSLLSDAVFYTNTFPVGSYDDSLATRDVLREVLREPMRATGADYQAVQQSYPSSPSGQRSEAVAEAQYQLPLAPQAELAH